MPARAFDLNDAATIDAHLAGISVVLHAAGPFIHTAQPMMQACLRNRIHYLDITGEIEVFEMAAQQDEAAQLAGIMVMPGVGFDVVPTDCTAAYLHQQLPDATHLELAFVSSGGVSQGTALTMVENLGEPGAERIGGQIVPVPVGAHSMWVPAEPKPRFAMSIPWGDVSTAFHTTGIPNIRTYMGFSPKAYRWVKLQRYLSWLLKLNWVRRMARKRIKKGPAGPSQEIRETAHTLVWGKVSNAEGKEVSATLITPEGYRLTAFFGLMIATQVAHDRFKPGFQTPAGCYGPELVLEMKGVKAWS